MRLITIAVASAALSAFALSAPATATEPELRLADVLAAVREQNPALRAATARARAAADVPARVSAWDDPTFSWEVFNAPESLRVDQADNNILKLTQRLPFPGKRSLAGRVAEHEAESVRLDLDRLTLDLTLAAAYAYADLWRAYELRAIVRRDGALAARWAGVATARYGANDGAQADVLAAEAERIDAVDREATAALQIDAARAELNALLSQPPDQPLGIPTAPALPHLTVDVDVLTRRALATRPELAAAAAAVTAAEDRVRLAERNYFPDFELTLSRFQNSGGRDGFGGMAAMTIPLAFRGKYDAARGEAEAGRDAATAERRRIEDMIRREVRQAYVRGQAGEIHDGFLRSTHLPLAEQRLRAAESGYGTGTIELPVLAERLQDVAETRREQVQSAADRFKARADLARAVGVPMEGLEAAAPPAAPRSAR